MSLYQVLKHLHWILALVSGLGYALRGFIRVIQRRPLTHPLARIGPHVVDTLLLVTGIALWIMIRYSPLAPAWFGVKLIGVAVYIVLGIVSFRQANRDAAVITYLAALGVFLAVAWLALYKPF